MNLFKFIGDTYRIAKALTTVDSRGTGGWFSIIREAWGGAWQQNIVVDAPRNILAFSAVFASVTVIAGDIAKLRVDLMKEDPKGFSTKVPASSPYWAVLLKPNPYQTLLQFIESWIVSKLLWGNTYVLKVRDQRGIVIELYVLDAQRVKVLVAENGDVYYEIARDDLAGVPAPITVPAREIIHDRMVCLWHPLVGISPIFACGMSATMGNRIQAQSTKFFENMSRPSGQLTSPTTINEITAARLKKEFEENFSGKNIGRIMVSGDGLKYEGMPGIPAQDAQLIEQLKWTVEDVARAFHVPIYKIGGPIPLHNTIDALNLGYYSDCLQSLIESLESSLDQGLALPKGYYTQVDLDGLLRMDNASLIKSEAEAVKGAIKSPNESRLRMNLPPKPGGDSLYLQQQNYSTEALAKRDAKPDPFAGPVAAPAPAPDPSQQPVTNAMLDEFAERVMQRLKSIPLALPAPAPESDEVLDMRQFLDEVAITDTFVQGLAEERI